MAVRIAFPAREFFESGVRAAGGTKVYNEDGTEIQDVTRIQIDVCADSILQAVITVAVSEIENTDGFGLGIVPEDCWVPDAISEVS